MEKKTFKEVLRSIAGSLSENIPRVLPPLLVLSVFSMIILTFVVTPEERVLREYFLPVGEGDSELVIAPSGAKILIDGGPADASILNSLDEIIRPTDRYIDVVILTHPQLDHFGGLVDILRSYGIGVLISNGLKGEIAAYRSLERELFNRDIKEISVDAGDIVRNGDIYLEFLSPDYHLAQNADVNDSALTFFVFSGGAISLFLSDVGGRVEDEIAPIVPGRVDVLKVSHHGSGNSSGIGFLKTIRPKVAIIEVGHNSYGHPSSSTIANLNEAGATVLRTDEDGLLEVVIAKDGEFKVLSH